MIRGFGVIVSIGIATSCLPEYMLVDGGSTFDAADETVVDAAPDTPPITTPEIFGKKLVLWLDADDPSTITFDDAGTGVTSWKDRSSWHNDAHTELSNDTSASPSSAITFLSTAAHGHGAMSFTGIWNATGIFSVPDSLTLDFATNDFAVTIVAAYVNTPGPDEYSNRAQLWTKTDPSPPYWGSIMIGNAYSAPLPDGGLGGADSIIYAGVENFIEGPSAGVWSSTDKWNDGKLHVFTMRKDNATSTMYVRTDGLETPSVASIATAIDLSGLGQPLQIGGHTVGTSCCWSVLHGDIAEVIAVNGSSMTPSERSALAAYIQAKYGLTL
jgi:hypothetical protein